MKVWGIVANMLGPVSTFPYHSIYVPCYKSVELYNILVCIGEVVKRARRVFVSYFSHA